MVTNRHSSSPYKGIVPANHFKVLLLHWCLKMPTKAQIPVMQIWKMLGMPRLMSNGKHVWKISVHTSAKLQTSVGRCQCSGYQGNPGRGKIVCAYFQLHLYRFSGGAGSRDTVRAKLQSVYFAQSLRLEENDNGDFSKSYLPIGRGSAHTNAKLEATGRNRTH